MTTYRVPHLIPILLSIGLIVLCTVFLLKFSFPRDTEGYYQLLEKIESSGKRGDLLVKQMRKGVTKEIWYTKGSDRLQAILRSRDAELCLEQVGQSRQIVEYLHGVTAVVQELCYYEDLLPMQKVRFVQSKNAVYYYSQETLIADNVIMEEFTLPGHVLPETLPKVLKKTHTTAGQVELRFKEGSLQVEADKIRASTL